MKERIALAYSGSLASSAAVAWLMERHGADVVTVTVDVGQSDDLDQVRARALACGARRAHVVDARDVFARDYVIPALGPGGVDDASSLSRLANPQIAKTLVEIAAIEAADAVAHAASPTAGEGPGTLDACLTGLDRSLRILAPAGEWGMDAARLADYARARNLPGTVIRPARHLLVRKVIDPAHAPDARAHLDIAFERGVPVALNDVQMTLSELIESLSLIAGQYGLGYHDGVGAPAAVVLRAAFAAAEGPDDVIRMILQRGTYRIETGSDVVFRAHSETGAGSVLSK